MIISKDGTTITQSGNSIFCSNGDTYMLSGRILIGPHGTESTNVGSIQEALGIVIGLHGGRRY